MLTHPYQRPDHFRRKCQRIVHLLGNASRRQNHLPNSPWSNADEVTTHLDRRNASTFSPIDRRELSGRKRDERGPPIMPEKC